MNNIGSCIKFYTEPYNRELCGFSFNDFLSWNNNRLEAKHDYIQWIFPIHTPSYFNSYAPVIECSRVEELRNNVISERQLKAYKRMLEFYGIKKTWFFGLKLINREVYWVTPGLVNHNYLRLSRIITSLRLFGNTKQARELYDLLLKHNTWYTKKYKKACFDTMTLSCWKKAMYGDLTNEI